MSAAFKRAQLNHQEASAVEWVVCLQRLPEEFLEELRRRVDIVDLISEHVQLRKTGRSFIGLCPFHNERSPSMSVSSERQMFHCFGCGAGGTVIRFVMDIEGISFPEAVEKLAVRANLSLPVGFNHTSGEVAKTELAERVRTANELAVKFYAHILMNSDVGAQALAYLNRREVSRSTAVSFQLGYAPKQADVLMNFLQRRGFTMEELETAGLVVEVGGRFVDRFRHRLMVPITNVRGQVVAFAGRALAADAKPKYLNSPETPVFRKSVTLFHHFDARKAIRRKRQAYLLEGYMDVIAAKQAGLEAVVATMGTSLTPEQASLLKRDCDTVVVVYDGDSAGIAAARRALDILEEAELEVRIVQLPGGLDPDEYIRTHGKAAFVREVSVHVLTPLQFLLRRLRQESDLLSPAGRTAFLRQAMEVVADRATPIEAESELRNLSQEFELSMESLKEEMHLVAKKSQKRKMSHRQSQENKTQPLPKGFIEAGQRILQMLMSDARTLAFIETYELDELATPEQTALLAMLCGWRAETVRISLSTFVDEIDSPDVRKLASALVLDELPEYDEILLADYVRKVRAYLLETQYKNAVSHLISAQIAGETEMVTEIKSQVDALLREMEALKSPHTGHHPPSGGQEARTR
ncbi:MAG: DNA primase [Alicyclobacillaceae bacterium]|jgi:DNA primase|nr:DNA primase [Alicyclobacillaceae bacterium]MCY0895179.1 DNA primase [Alicyclobacillaceae bacterium]